MKKYDIPRATVVSIAAEDIMALSAEGSGYGLSVTWESLFDSDAMSIE